MKPCRNDMRVTNSNSITDLHPNRRPEGDASQLHHHVQSSHFDPTFSHDDFFDQMLSTIPSWELNPSTLQIPTTTASAGLVNGHAELRDFTGDVPHPPSSNPESIALQFDESANLAAKLCGYQISETSQAAKVAMAMLQQELLMARGMASDGDSGLLPMPGGNMDAASCNGVVEGSSSFKCPNPISDGSVPSLYNGFPGYLHGSGSGSGHNQNQSQHPHLPQAGNSQTQNFGVPGAVNNNNAPQSSVPGSGGTAPAQPRQRVRARRGQATDPHSIAERLRRERIAERMKALQELVPNGNKTDKASMLDEIIDYVKFLQLQVKVLSMSRLGGATVAMSSLVPDISSEGGADCNQPNGTGGAVGQTSTAALSSNDTMTVTERQVAKLMEDDMGSAMQYLQGKGLCLMPISLATAISAATCRSHPLTASKGGGGGGEGPTSPTMSALTVQSATLGNNGTIDRAVKDAASASRP